ncbi:DUF58 domain-containing protein [Kibdelosporangium persicum]|uniref:DUF58 domain-containing protein n=1 Tax=Kibdelosporangium persicum TaxID=2698649 RepID=A0ABX2FF54_9PSEU|nr:DUF58 domain-containing protein [Kibdelosporangium persicum]NRN70016.1 DUF58 domain-containing protein [Kibdelosporangium persicum]
MITATGLTVAATGVILLLAGVWIDSPELVILGFACVMALLVAAAWLLARPRLTVLREINPGRVEEGAVVHGVLTVTNVGRRRSTPLLAVETVADHRVTVPLPSLAVGENFETVYSLPPFRRGRYVIPPVTLDHSDPLRLLHSGRTSGREALLSVYPRVHHIDPLPLGGPRDVEGPTSASSPQDGVAFHSLRVYQPGDDWRRIHWKSTARTGELMVRHNVIPNEPRHVVILDTSAKPYSGSSFEEAVRVAASLCVAAEKVGHPLVCGTTADLDVAEGEAAALDLLSGVRCSTSDRGLLALDAMLGAIVPAGERVALSIVTGQADPGELASLAVLRSQFLAVSLVHIGQVDVEALPGVVTIGARTSTEFEARWNQLVRS